MDLNSINANVNRLLTNIVALISFLKEFAVDEAKDVSVTYVNADGSESVKTFPNVAKQRENLEEVNTFLENGNVDSADKISGKSLNDRVQVGRITPTEWSYSSSVKETLTGSNGRLYNEIITVEKRSIIIASVTGHWWSNSSWCQYGIAINNKGCNYDDKQSTHGYESDNAKRWRRVSFVAIEEVEAGDIDIALCLSSFSGVASINGSSIVYTIIEIGA